MGHPYIFIVSVSYYADLSCHHVFNLNSQLSNLLSGYNLQLTANNQHWFRTSSWKLIVHFVVSNRSGLTFLASCCLCPLCFRLFSIFTFVDSSHFSTRQKVSQLLLCSAPSLASQAMASFVVKTKSKKRLGLTLSAASLFFISKRQVVVKLSWFKKASFGKYLNLY